MVAGQGPVEPGGRGKISVTVDTGKLRGALRKTVTVLSNDPTRPLVTLVLKAVVRDEKDVSP